MQNLYSSRYCNIDQQLSVRIYVFDKIVEFTEIAYFKDVSL